MAQCDFGALPGAEEHTMDYEFLRDITGVVKVRMSMGHEVVGHWFNEEVKENPPCLMKWKTQRARSKAANDPAAGRA